MSNILITGVTGNVGLEVIKALAALNAEHVIIAAHHQPETARQRLEMYKKLQYRKLDFSMPTCFAEALKDIDIVFLLRPPQLADIRETFLPFLQAMKTANVNKVVFLSVQGVENNPNIPHYQLEKLIVELGFEYVFLRPSYFMQNLTSTLLREIVEESRVYIPAGKLKLVWVDVRDIGRVAAHILADFGRYVNTAPDITGNEVLDFYQIAEILSDETGRKINFVSPNLVRFYLHKRKQNTARAMIFVMIMLHYLPMFSKEKPKLSSIVREILGDEPGSVRDFIRRERLTFIPKK
ncbi:MAG: NmrA family NAD(P)-binding protein [Cyclobacteriaceae bacterium]|nr:NmrA family NAD(P)-binding protein [Cyclobacteriaceae bacterium]